MLEGIALDGLITANELRALREWLIDHPRFADDELFVKTRALLEEHRHGREVRLTVTTTRGPPRGSADPPAP